MELYQLSKWFARVLLLALADVVVIYISIQIPLSNTRLASNGKRSQLGARID